MIFDFSKKEDVIKFNSISSSWLKKISANFITNINTRETVAYIDDIKDLKFFQKRGLNINVAFSGNEKERYPLNDRISDHINNLDKLKFLHEQGFDFKSDIYLNVCNFQTHELREYYINHIYDYRDKASQISTLDTIIRHKDFDIFLLFVERFNTDLHDKEIPKSASFCGQNVFHKAFDCCAYDIAKYLVIEKNFEFFECLPNTNLCSENLMKIEIKENQHYYEGQKAILEDLKKENASLHKIQNILWDINQHEEKLKMLGLYPDIINEQRKRLHTEIPINNIQLVKKARL